jgi:hypothetical protein
MAVTSWDENEQKLAISNPKRYYNGNALPIVLASLQENCYPILTESNAVEAISAAVITGSSLARYIAKELLKKGELTKEQSDALKIRARY